MGFNRKQWIVTGVAVVLVAGGYYAWKALSAPGLPEGIAGGNGRIEAVEIDVSTKSPGRIREILADEGQFVEANAVLARMDTDQLESQRKQAEAQLRRAEISIDTAKSLVAQRKPNKLLLKRPLRSARRSWMPPIVGWFVRSNCRNHARFLSRSSMMIVQLRKGLKQP